MIGRKTSITRDKALFFCKAFATNYIHVLYNGKCKVYSKIITSNTLNIKEIDRSDRLPAWTGRKLRTLQLEPFSPYKKVWRLQIVEKITKGRRVYRLSKKNWQRRTMLLVLRINLHWVNEWRKRLVIKTRLHPKMRSGVQIRCHSYNVCENKSRMIMRDHAGGVS